MTILVQSLYDEACLLVMLVKIQLSNNNINRRTTFFNEKFVKTIKLNYEFYNYSYPGLSPSCKRCFTLLVLGWFPCLPPLLRYQYTNAVLVSKLQICTFSQKKCSAIKPLVSDWLYRWGWVHAYLYHWKQEIQSRMSGFTQFSNYITRKG